MILCSLKFFRCALCLQDKIRIPLQRFSMVCLLPIYLHPLLPIFCIPHTLFILYYSCFPKYFTVFSNSFSLWVLFTFLEIPLFSNLPCLFLLQKQPHQRYSEKQAWGQTPYLQKVILWSTLSLEDQRCHHCIRHIPFLQHQVNYITITLTSLFQTVSFSSSNF